MFGKTPILQLALKKRSRRAVLRRGFTLIELLFVLAIMAILAALVGPSVNTLLRPSQLTQGAHLVCDQLSLARQTAISRNLITEVRFYQYADTTVPGEQPGNAATGKYRAMQMFQIQESGSAVALSKVQRLPASLVIDSGSPLSSLIGQALAAPNVPTLATGNTVKVPIAQAGTSYNTACFRFLPSGATNLSPLATSRWFLTLHSLKDGDSLAAPPANFFTIQIDACNGHLKTFRP
ncbi:MAG: Verru_Chthon cassette protein D [Chthoniobacteraceae bacterium]